MSNQQDQHPRQNAQKAAAFFNQASLSRLVAKLYEKYIEVGQVGGQIILPDCTANERRDIASFLSKPLYPTSTIKVKLVDVERALKHSFDCTLPDMLCAYFPDQKLVTRTEQRAIRATQQAQFHSTLLSLATELPQASRGRHWLQHGLHGQEWLFSRYKNAPIEEQYLQLEQIRYVANLLDQLPQPDAPERIAVFAQRTSGNPHALDPSRPAGRLFLLALNDLVRSSQQDNKSGDLYHDEGMGETLPALDTLSTAMSPQDRTQELDLYTNAGLLVDTISSNVAVFNLANAIYPDGTPDPLPQAAGKRVLLLPLRQLLEWQSAMPSQADIYVVENPQVFEEIIVMLGPASTSPTLVCTSGWPSVAAMKLLDLLLLTSSSTRIHYSGDFDVKGLQIATYLMARYPDRYHPWHFDPDSYAIALQAGGIPASENDLNMLGRLPAIFSSLVASMQQKRKWAYQEGIVHLLAADAKHCGID
ncbi:MAG: TIGR02679 family protein [Ktedonobacteraceae bacterium]